jgi:hypothetical protein
MTRIVSIFRNIRATTAGHQRDVEVILDRIRTGKSKELIEHIRSLESKDERNKLKENLPSICFSGTFSHRKAEGLQTHSGIIALDFDSFENVETLNVWRDTIQADEYTFSLFTSPSGDGLKVLTLIPPTTADGHKEYFAALAFKWDTQYFDMKTADVSRVCYESYDPDLYYNPNAKVWTDKIEQEVFDKAVSSPVIPITSDTRIISVVLKWWESKHRGKDHGKAGSGRNASMVVLANSLNRFGIDIHTAEQVCSQYAEGGKEPFPVSEINNIIRKAYRNTSEHRTAFLEDNEAHRTIEKSVRAGKTVKEIERATGIDKDKVEMAVFDAKSSMAITDYWHYNDKGKVVLSPHQYKFFLEQNQFFKFYPEGSGNYLFVKIDSNLLEDTGTAHIKDFVLNDLMQRTDIGYMPYDFMANQTRLFKEDYLSMLATAEVNLKKDDDETCYLYFKNAALRVGLTSVEVIDYIDLDGFVWKKHVIDRDWKGVPAKQGGMFERFVRLIAGEDSKRYDSLRSVAGYLLHSHKTSAHNKAIIFNDETVSDNPNGGSGKGLFCRAISHMKRVTTLDGKQFSFDKSFPYQTVGADTQVLVFDDVRKNFAFEQLFSLITEGITLEKKNKDAIHIPVSRSPKLVITTNYTIGGVGGSFERRKFELELSGYFGAHHTPFDEFGKMMFDDWDADEWARFDAFMVGCVQFYLANGLVSHEFNNLELRKYIKETSSEFVEWATNDNLPTGQRLDKGAMHKLFIEEYGDYAKWLTQRKFTTWMEAYGKNNAYKVTQGKSGALRWIEFERSGDSPVIVVDEIDEDPF